MDPAEPIGPVEVIGVFVINEKNEILLVEEQKDGYTGLLKIITGHVEPSDESPSAAADREVWEETGYRLGSMYPYDAYEYEGARGDRLRRINFVARPLTAGPEREGELRAVWRPFRDYFDGISQVDSQYHEPTYRDFQSTLAEIHLLIESGTLGSILS